MCPKKPKQATPAAQVGGSFASSATVKADDTTTALNLDANAPVAGAVDLVPKKKRKSVVGLDL